MRWRWDTAARPARVRRKRLLEWAGQAAGGQGRGGATDGGVTLVVAPEPDGLPGNGRGVTGGTRRRALTVLGAGHMCMDLCQGAVPALLPFLAAEHGYSYAALGALVLFSTIGSSIVQPLFGLLSDRIATPWLMPGGLALAGMRDRADRPGAVIRADGGGGDRLGPRRGDVPSGGREVRRAWRRSSGGGGA